jgi:hypothetical protein
MLIGEAWIAFWTTLGAWLSDGDVLWTLIAAIFGVVLLLGFAVSIKSENPQ